MSLLRRRMMLNSAISALSNPKLLFSAENMKLARDGEFAEQGVGITEYYPVQVNQTIKYFNPLTSHTLNNYLGNIVIYNSNKQYADWWNCRADGLEGSFTQDKTEGVYFRLNVVMDTEADVYCYNQTTGQVYYAGINTQYYGKQNIND